MFKKANVVMLATNKESILAIDQYGKLYNNKISYPYSRNYQHLYITSDEEIKEGDWYYDCESKVKPAICKLANDELPMSYDRKIIASINLSLNLPQPSLSFIQKYIEEYNKGNVITDVMVEYYPNDKEWSKTFGDGSLPEYLKVNPKYSSITIKKAKNSWTKEELSIVLYNSLGYFANKHNIVINGNDINNWINKNL